MGRERGLTWSSRFVRQFNSVLALPAWMQYTATACVSVCECISVHVSVCKWVLGTISKQKRSEAEATFLFHVVRMYSHIPPDGQLDGE